MRVWLVKTGEPLPMDRGTPRAFRMGLLARELARAGHDVTWWTSAFNHAEKTHRACEDRTVRVEEGYQIEMLFSPGYGTNVSLARVRDHRAFARAFGRRARSAAVPDIVVSAFPVPDVCVEATRYARLARIPAVIDVRDLWPDAQVDLLPQWLRPLGRVGVLPMRRQVRYALRNATAITAVSEGYLSWGLAHAGRTRGTLDRAFAMGYPGAAPVADAVGDARRYWREAHGLEEGRGDFISCFFGAVGHQFDLDTVLGAARLLRDRARRQRFVLCGRGDSLERLRAKAADLPNVVFAGWVGHAEIWALMGIASVGLAPYRDSNQFVLNVANKPIEYMAGGLGVVSSLKGDLERLLATQRCGVTYENGRPDQLAGILEELAGDPDRVAQFGTNARRLFEERFVAEKVYAEMAKYLETVARPSGRC
jgi:glycosyltransferase involved in cell wall biosynthesis